VERRELTFESGGESCAAWHLSGAADEAADRAGRPCVVMAHGLAGTRDSGLLPFAEAFARAGLDALLFDYRCFGDSTGEPRQLASPRRHRQDYAAAVARARELPGVDPARIVLWGTSWSGGHCVYVASEDPSIAAVIAQTPDLDGARTLGMIAGHGGYAQLLRITAHGLRDRWRALRGTRPHLIPVVGPPGSVGAMTSEDSEPGYLAIAGPTWRNELTARAALEEGRNRAVTRASRVRCPLLIQVALRDSVAAPNACLVAAARAPRAELISYPIAHFDVYLGAPRERSISDQLDFLRRHVSPQDRGDREAAASPA
jgi:fermentation-respiration switch protein FrsA (DUF1100 family)